MYLTVDRIWRRLSVRSEKTRKRRRRAGGPGPALQFVARNGVLGAGFALVRLRSDGRGDLDGFHRFALRGRSLGGRSLGRRRLGPFGPGRLTAFGEVLGPGLLGLGVAGHADVVALGVVGVLAEVLLVL